MKQEYLTNLSQSFDDKGVAVETYSQIVDKYRTWYDKLLADGKSDDEIYTILKSPEEVSTIFAEKFGVTQTVETTQTTQTIETTESFEAFDSQQVINETVQTTEQPVYNNVPQYTQPNQNFNNYIVKTNKRGKEKFFEKRSFLGGLGIFFVFLLVSSLCLPVLFTLFSATLTLSFLFMLLFFTPFYYLVFIWRYDSVSALQHVATESGFTPDVLTLPIDKINDVIAYLNEITSFDFPVFLQTVLMSIFGFAGLLLSLYLCLTMFRANVAYFSWFFNKMSLKKVRKKDLV